MGEIKHMEEDMDRIIYFLQYICDVDVHDLIREIKHRWDTYEMLIKCVQDIAEYGDVHPPNITKTLAQEILDEIEGMEKG